MRKLQQTKGQVWIETVLYTLIGLAIIGVVLTVAKPKIDAKKDEVVIEQAIEAMNGIDDKVRAVFSQSAGNRRTIELSITSGEFIIDMENNALTWQVDSSFEYSETNKIIKVGKIGVYTERGDPYDVYLNITYGVDLQYQGVNTGKQTFAASPTPYSILVENAGENNDGNVIVNFIAA